VSVTAKVVKALAETVPGTTDKNCPLLASVLGAAPTFGAFAPKKRRLVVVGMNGPTVTTLYTAVGLRLFKGDTFVVVAY
jgi:hypothetical protein